MKIVMCASEVVPFAKTGGLADVAGALPLALEELGHDVIIVMPRYKTIQNSKVPIKRLSDDISYSITGKNIKVYFIENEVYFGRDTLYGDKNGDYPDNLDRFAYFCCRSLELLKEIKFKPQVIHCHDWQSALIPVFLKKKFFTDPFYKDIKSLFTIHNIGYQGLFLKDEFPKLGLDWSLFSVDGLEFYDKVNILKGGLVFSDIINTVSPTYSKEIQTKAFGFGLEGVLEKRKSALFGILNGIDYSIWCPETDSHIAKNYSVTSMKDKAVNKADLQKYCKLPVIKNVPLLGIVSRLAEQKGFDILAEAVDKICRMKLQLVILGAGDAKYQDLLTEMTQKYPRVISLNIKFDDVLAHKIYAGSDIFLMPSKYEPCGLGQLISLRYGAIPLVFKTGGLADTVNTKNGFIFDEYSSDTLVKTITKALQMYGETKKWGPLVTRAMQCDYSWEESAKAYVKLYEKAVKNK
ncbi:MAG TPA: glycogen synthase GlgA [Candidatus Omnitrophota bacterium]|nr:glycogen synthase GlgA [Candidatus Omnitrophota bacterium]HPT06743.1 glycogen synthase GlgA [Candidatus Omnitrophota bacterium]